MLLLMVRRFLQALDDSEGEPTACNSQFAACPDICVELPLQVLQWTRDWPRAQELAYRVACIFAEEVAQVTHVSKLWAAACSGTSMCLIRDW